MIHLATEELDRGPPVAYGTYSLRGPAFDPLWRALGPSAVVEGEEHPLVQEIRDLGTVRELPLVVATLRAFAQGRLRFEGRRVVDTAGRELSGGLDLTTEIDAAVESSLAEEASGGSETK